MSASTSTDQAENITSCMMFIASLIDATKNQARHRHDQHAQSHPAAIAAQIAMLDHMLDGRFIFGISPGGLLSDAEVFGNLDADRNAMFLEAINQVLAIWAERAALRPRRQVLERSRSSGSAMPRDRPGLSAQAAAEAASADRGHGGGAVLQGRDRGRGARLGSDLGELPDAGVGEEPLAEICRGLRARRPHGRSGELARRQEHLRRRRRQDREGLRDRAEQPVSLLLQPALHQAEARPARPVQDAARPARQRGDARRHLRRADHPRLARQGGRRDPEVPRAGRRFRHAALCRQGLARPEAGEALDDLAGREGAAQGQRARSRRRRKSREAGRAFSSPSRSPKAPWRGCARSPTSKSIPIPAVCCRKTS